MFSLCAPQPPADIWAMMIVWRIKASIIRTVGFFCVFLTSSISLSFLTLSGPVASNGYTTKCSMPSRSKLHFKFFDIRALWRFVLSARVPECQKIKNGGLDQYGAERFGRLILATIIKSVGLNGLTLVFCSFFIALDYCLVVSTNAVDWPRNAWKNLGATTRQCPN